MIDAPFFCACAHARRQDVLGRQINDFIKAMDRWNQRPRSRSPLAEHLEQIDQKSLLLKCVIFFWR